jgi:hypothetical protein
LRSGISFTHLRPEIFMQNLLGYGGAKAEGKGVIRHYFGDARDLLQPSTPTSIASTRSG